MENEMREGPDAPVGEVSYEEENDTLAGEGDTAREADALPAEEVPEGGEGEPSPDGEDGALGEYRRRAREDLEAIRRLRPEYSGAESLAELPLAVPFALFRGMGYGVEESLAFAESGAARLGGKSHQRPVATRRRGATETGMTFQEMADCRELFGDGLSDGEIRALYLKVTR